MTATNEKAVQVLNIDIDDISVSELLDGRINPRFLIPVNVDVLMKLQKDRDFYRFIKEHRTETCICLDSQIIKMAAKSFLGKGFREKISGSDLFPAYCRHNASNQEIRIFLAGAMDGVAKEAASRINKRVGREIIVDVESPPYGFEKDEDASRKLVDRINNSRATVLALGVGAPKQEKWIYKHASELPDIRLFMAIGATIDFEAGNIERAPVWISNMGMEWLYRLSKEPGRLAKRYLIDDIPFFWYVMQQRLGFYKDPFNGEYE